jgi:hypothetical protein
LRAKAFRPDSFFLREKKTTEEFALGKYGKYQKLEATFVQFHFSQNPSVNKLTQLK